MAIAHHQAAPGLGLTVGFAGAAGLAALVPHDTGTWLPLHLFLLGALLSAISAAAPLLAVTWSTSTPPASGAVRAQRVLLTGGVVGLAAARELDAAAWWIGASGAAVVASLVLLGAMLVGIRRRAQLDRFHPAIDGYLLALGLGVAGCGLGIALAVEPPQADRALREAHLTVNLLGLVGVVVLATLPYLAATQLRMRRPPRATGRRLRAVTATAAGAVLLAAGGLLGGAAPVAAAGYAVYAGALVGTVALCPFPRRRQLRWAGPRALLVLAGMAWWLVAVAGVGAAVAAGDAPSTRLLLVLVVGGFGQILAGSLAYLGPVVRGGGQERLTAGFAASRSAVSLVAANVAVVGIMTGTDALVVAGLGAWLVDVTVRSLWLTRPDPTS